MKLNPQFDDGLVLVNEADLRPGAVCLANDSRFSESYFNQPLTGFAVGWRDPNDIQGTLNFVAPPVTVGRYFTYAEATNADEFITDTDDERAIGAEFKRVEFTATKTTAKTANKGLTYRVDTDEVKDTPNWRQDKVAKLLRRIYRNDLKRAVTLLAAAATNTAKTWDTTAGKDPDYDVIADLVTASDSSGVRPTRLLYGDTAWQKRLLSLRAQNLAGQGMSAGMTPEELARFLTVDRVYISRERYQSSATAKTQVVANLVLMFNAADGLDTEDASNIKRFVSPTMDGGLVRVYEQQMGPHIIDLTVEHYSLVKITSTLGIRKFTVS
jgi:hypothetical protein